MATRTVVQLLDDIDGSAADETVRFGLDDRTYELDLNSTNAQELRDTLASYVSVARVTGRAKASRNGRARATTSRPSAANRVYDSTAVRRWASSNGIDVSSRGRLPRTVLDAFTAAGN